MSASHLLRLQGPQQTPAQLTTECQEMEKLMDALNQKKQFRAEKLDTIDKKQIQSKEYCDQERGKVDIYSKRIKEYLGLSITETTTNSTLLVFNNIDERDTDRKFLCEYTLEGPNATVYKGMYVNDQSRYRRACVSMGTGPHHVLAT